MSDSSTGTKSFASRLSGLRVVVAYLVIPNLVFWLAGHIVETLPRAVMNLDYLLVAVCARFLKRWQSVTLMCLAILVDTARCLGPLYYFSQRDAVDALVFLREVSFAHVALSILVIVTPAVFLGWALVRVGGSGIVLREKTGCLVALVVILGAVGVWGGNSSLRFRDQAAGLNLCTSAGVGMAKTVASAILRQHDRVEPVQVESATRRAGWFSDIPKTRNLVLVVVESGAEPVDPAWKAVVNSTWSDPELQKHYRVEAGAIPFTGATVPGEFRELCGVKSAVIEKPTDDEAVMRNCLPWRMRDAGLTTTYIHGFSPEMFTRGEWISQLGFEKELFHPQLHNVGLADCGGPFRGICDTAVAGWIGDQLVADSSHKNFIHWMTLNSHLPVDADAEASAALNCGKETAAIKDEASCNLIALVVRTERAVSRVALRPDLPKTEFVIVGDHAPPFILKQRREYFSQTAVPFIHLVPR